MNAVIEASVHPEVCFSMSNILAATTCIAHCASSDFAMGQKLASALAYGYPELQQLRKNEKNVFHSLSTRLFSHLI